MLINKIRHSPSFFAPNIESAVSNITTFEGRLTLKGAVEVSLKTSEPAFKQAEDHLRQMHPLEPFHLYEDIAIRFLTMNLK